MSVLSKGLTGAVLIWFSHCSVIILTGIGIALTAELIHSRSYKSFPGYFLMCFLWVISFGINYYFFIFNHANQLVQESSFISAGYLPPVGTLNDKIHWLLPLLKQTITYHFGINSATLYILLLCTGIWYIFRFKQYQFLTLLIPLIIHIILSFLYIYPFGGRFILYNSTLIILYVVLGLKATATKIKVVGLPIAGVILVLTLMYPVRRSLPPIEFEEIKPCLEYIQNHKNVDDVIYIHFTSLPAFRFYTDRYSLGESEIIKGSPADIGFDKDLDIFKRDNRVWILMTHFNDHDRAYIFSKCDESGRMDDLYEYGGALTALFSFPVKAQ